MKIEYVHASKYGNGALVAIEFTKQMAGHGIDVAVHHVRDMRRTELSPADLYVFSSPGRMGRPIRSMRRFLRKVKLPEGTRYALLTTEATPKPNSASEWQRVRPIMNEILQGKGLVKVAEERVLVTGLKGPLEEEWQKKVQAFANQVAASFPVQRSSVAAA